MYAPPPMSFDAIHGQPRAVAVLQSALAHRAVPHAYLFAGPEGVGKELTARTLARALLCPERPDVGCDVCATCLRVDRLGHPDLPWVMPEAEQVARGLAGRSDFSHVPSRDIRVEQIRTLQERISFRGLESKRKVALILSAERMTPQAQNAFLKTLEEPPADTVLVLVASAPDLLLTTLRSRCSRLPFGPLPLAFVAARIEKERKVDAATARLVATLADGSLSRALEVDVRHLADRRALFEAFEAAHADDLRTVLRFSEQRGASRDDAEAALRLLVVWTRDLALVKVGVEQLANADLLDFARDVAAQLPEAALHRRHRALDKALMAITQRNGAARVHLERMLLDVTGAGA